MPIKIEIAKHSSFCPGVQRACRIAEETLSAASGPVFSTGQLIHNPQAVSRLRSLGLEVMDASGGETPDLDGTTVVIRSHGIDTGSEQALVEHGALLVDATCPTVKHSQVAAQELAAEGYKVIVLGSRLHPEVRSIAGRTDGDVTVLESVEEAREWIEGEGAGTCRVGIISQTTASRELLESVVSFLRDRVPEVETRDTMCSSVAERQEEAVELAARVEVMLVVGGSNSSNTQRLAEIVSSAGTRTFHIEEPSEIREGWLEGVESVGLIGGSSTPEWLIEETVARLKEITRD